KNEFKNFIKLLLTINNDRMLLRSLLSRYSKYVVSVYQYRIRPESREEKGCENWHIKVKPFLRETKGGHVERDAGELLDTEPIDFELPLTKIGARRVYRRFCRKYLGGFDKKAGYPEVIKRF
ncbi:MAG: hypothetical protein JSV39_03965, partial [Candidatus Aenigmatarchaeota archaeon]